MDIFLRLYIDYVLLNEWDRMKGRKYIKSRKTKKVHQIFGANKAEIINYKEKPLQLQTQGETIQIKQAREKERTATIVRSDQIRIANSFEYQNFFTKRSFLTKKKKKRWTLGDTDLAFEQRESEHNSVQSWLLCESDLKSITVLKFSADILEGSSFVPAFTWEKIHFALCLAHYRTELSSENIVIFNSRSPHALYRIRFVKEELHRRAPSSQLHYTAGDLETRVLFPLCAFAFYPYEAYTQQFQVADFDKNWTTFRKKNIYFPKKTFTFFFTVMFSWRPKYLRVLMGVVLFLPMTIFRIQVQFQQLGVKQRWGVDPSAFYLPRSCHVVNKDNNVMHQHRRCP